MLKTIFNLIKWFFLFWIYLLAGSLLAGIVVGLLSGLTNSDIDGGVLVIGFTGFFIVRHILRGKRKKAAARAELKAKEEAEEARREAARLKNEYAAAIDGYREKLEDLAQKIKDRPTASKTADIAVLMRKIALETEADSRDRRKVRNLSDHGGQMIVDLVDKYVKLERQNQSSSNILAAMAEIRGAMDNVEITLKTLLDDLFSNDSAEVSANVAVLESILSGINPECRMNMDMDSSAEEGALSEKY